MGNTYRPVVDSFWYMAKPIQYLKLKNKIKKNKIKLKKKRKKILYIRLSSMHILCFKKFRIWNFSNYFKAFRAILHWMIVPLWIKTLLQF